MEHEQILTAQTSPASEGIAAAENGYADVLGEEKGEGAADARFSDSHTGETEALPKERREQSVAQNRENAQRRREAELRRSQELERERQSAREAAILEILDGQNPYTGESMTDSRDVEEYLLMREIDRQGGDPERDFAKFRKAKERERAEQSAREEQTAEWYRQDRESFVAKYPDVDLNGLIEDEGFALFAEGKTGKRPLTEIYEGYRSLMGEQTKQARQMAARMVANRRASPGALASADSGEGGFFSADEVRRMSPSDIHRNYEKIKESMKSWK